MPATYSIEGRIEAGLRELQCSGRNFLKIAKALGVSISDGKFSEALNDKGRLDTTIGEKLLDLVKEMCDLQTVVPGTPLDWSRVDVVPVLMMERRAIKLAVEDDIERVRKLLGVENVGATDSN